VNEKPVTFELVGHTFTVYDSHPVFPSKLNEYAWTVFCYQERITSLALARDYGLDGRQFKRVNNNIVGICREGGLNKWLNNNANKNKYRPSKFGKHFEGGFYGDYLQTEHWQTLRKKVHDKYKGACALCRGTGQLDVHHMSYERLASDGEFIDLVLLCRKCHTDFHDYYEYNPNTGEFDPADQGQKENIRNAMWRFKDRSSKDAEKAQDLYHIWKNGGSIEPPFHIDVSEYL